MVGTHPIHLSQAHVTELEATAVARAVRGGWVAPLGPEVDAFEADVCAYTGAGNAVALSSGTAAIHLGLLGLGVKPGDEVLVATLTFGATAFAVTYTGAQPVFLDVEEQSWNLDAALLERVLKARAEAGRSTAAIIPVDVFGRTADYDSILPVAAEHGVPVFVDAAESLGARNGSRPAGSLGAAAALSFNGNKIMTTSGGGMLLTDDPALAAKVRFWATQSREPFPWYEHEEIGFNHRMSNILAALGRVQLQRLPQMIGRRRTIRAMYADLLSEVPGLEVVSPDPPWGVGNSWLTTVRFNLARWPDGPMRVRESLGADRIEARPIWKPMHAQPVFASAERHLTGVADQIFADGLCLPSGAGLTDEDILRVAEGVRAALA